jgi:hypothetical protein
MHASRACFVSGQQQQIFLPDLMPTLCALSLTTTGGGGGGVDDDEFPMVQIEEDTAMEVKDDGLPRYDSGGVMSVDDSIIFYFFVVAGAS